MMRVVVLYGGKSNEHDVSRVSGAAVYYHLAENGRFELIPIGIDRGGAWYLQDHETTLEAAEGGRLSVVSDRTRRIGIFPGEGLKLNGGDLPIQVDCVFPVLHGKNGEDGTVQGALELAGVPYVGSTIIGSAVGMDKVSAKRIWLNQGIPVVPYRTVDAYEYGTDPGTARIRAEELGYPLFVKPNAAGSSMGISRVNGPEDLSSAIEEALKHDDLVLLENALEIREIETAVLGNDTPRAFTPGEVIPSHGFYDYDAKYIDPDGAALEIPARLDENTLSHVRELAVRAFTSCRCRGLARVDCFLEKKSGRVYLNEINTIPGFTPISMYPKLAEADGLPYGELLAELIRMAL